MIRRMMDRAGGRRGTSSLRFMDMVTLKSRRPAAERPRAPIRYPPPGDAEIRDPRGPDGYDRTGLCRAARDRRLVLTGVDRRGVGDAWRGALEPARLLAPPRIGYLPFARPSSGVGACSWSVEVPYAVLRTRFDCPRSTRHCSGLCTDHDEITMMPVRAPHDAMSSVGTASATREISMSSDMRAPRCEL